MAFFYIDSGQQSVSQAFSFVIIGYKSFESITQMIIYRILTDLLLLILVLPNCTCFNLELVQPKPLTKEQTIIFKDGNLEQEYNDTEYSRFLSCANGQLTIIQFQRTNGNASIKFSYTDANISKEKIKVETLFDEPLPVVQEVSQDMVVIKSGCLGENTNKNNYFNKIDITITLQRQKDQAKDYKYSFLLGCDKGGRNKKFQIGYIIIAIMNAIITIGVALHSRIWSIRYLGRPISIQLKWHRFLILMIAIMAIGIALYLYAADQFKNANFALRYIGLAIAYISSFICADQIFFLVRRFKQQIWKFIRICDIISFVVSTIIFGVGFVIDDWIYYDILAMGICVGAIKLLRFSTMKQAFISMAISIIFVSIVSSILHFTLDRSYNDYANQLSSPLFLVIPDFVSQLYKKCSWLPTIDVIVPGVFLSFLRTYDENYNTGWGGVYTVIGNLSFILSTILWVLLEAVYPYSIPFSLITYSFLAISIFLMSYKRNQFKTLWTGRFNGANNEMSQNLLAESNGQRQSFSKLVTSDLIDSIKYDKQEDESEQNDHQQQQKKEPHN